MKRFILALIIFLSYLGAAFATHDGQEPGYKMTLYAYCDADGDKPVQGYEVVKQAITAGSDAIYMDIMTKADSKCYDTRLIGRAAPTIELMSKYETFKTDGGLCVAVWRIKVHGGTPEEVEGFSWIQCKEDK